MSPSASLSFASGYAQKQRTSRTILEDASFPVLFVFRSLPHSVSNSAFDFSHLVPDSLAFPIVSLHRGNLALPVLTITQLLQTPPPTRVTFDSVRNGNPYQSEERRVG